MLRHPGDWTIYACSIPERDPIRALYFHRACYVLGARGIVMPYIERVEGLVGLEHLDLSDADEIVTHNQVGEYGHKHHKQLHDYLTTRYRSHRIVTFGRGLKNAMTFELTADEEARKLNALKSYGHWLPYNGQNMPKWQALIERYKIETAVESYANAA